MSVKAFEIMTKNLVTFRPDTNIFDVMRLLVQHAISGGPVLDESGALIGIISEKDCLKVLVQTSLNDGPAATVDDHMTREVITITPETHLMAIAELFLKHPIRRLPVMEKGRLVGQVSRRNVVQAVLELGPGMRWSSPTHQGAMAGNTKHADAVGPITNTKFAG